MALKVHLLGDEAEVVRNDQRYHSVTSLVTSHNSFLGA